MGVDENGIEKCRDFCSCLNRNPMHIRRSGGYDHLV